MHLYLNISHPLHREGGTHPLLAAQSRPDNIFLPSHCHPLHREGGTHPLLAAQSLIFDAEEILEDLDTPKGGDLLEEAAESKTPKRLGKSIPGKDHAAAVRREEGPAGGCVPVPQLTKKKKKGGGPFFLKGQLFVQGCPLGNVASFLRLFFLKKC